MKQSKIHKVTGYSRTTISKVISGDFAKISQEAANKILGLWNFTAKTGLSNQLSVYGKQYQNN